MGWRIFLVVSLVLTLGLGVLTFQVWSLDLGLVGEESLTTGEIVSNQTTGSVSQLVFDYEVAGKRWRGTIHPPAHQYSAYRPGQTVTVVFLPDEPQYSTLQGHRPYARELAAKGGAAIVCLLLVMVSMPQALRAANKAS
ncbi:MAG: DUF3592 domain-containing protein [Vulcanimicrobiota bacterium]